MSAIALSFFKQPYIGYMPYIYDRLMFVLVSIVGLFLLSFVTECISVYRRRYAYRPLLPLPGPPPTGGGDGDRVAGIRPNWPPILHRGLSGEGDSPAPIIPRGRRSSEMRSSSSSSSGSPSSPKPIKMPCVCQNVDFNKIRFKRTLTKYERRGHIIKAKIKVRDRTLRLCACGLEDFRQRLAEEPTFPRRAQSPQPLLALSPPDGRTTLNQNVGDGCRSVTRRSDLNAPSTSSAIPMIEYDINAPSTSSAVPLIKNDMNAPATMSSAALINNLQEMDAEESEFDKWSSAESLNSLSSLPDSEGLPAPTDETPTLLTSGTLEDNEEDSETKIADQKISE